MKPRMKDADIEALIQACIDSKLEFIQIVREIRLELDIPMREALHFTNLRMGKMQDRGNFEAGRILDDYFGGIPK